MFIFEKIKDDITDLMVIYGTNRYTMMGKSDVDYKGFNRAIEFFVNYGVNVVDNDYRYTGINIVIDDTISDIQEDGFLTFKMSRKTLMGVYRKMCTLGIPGRHALRALADAVKDLDDKTFEKLTASANSIEDYLEPLCRSIGITDIIMDKDYLEMVLHRVGGYSGLRAVLCEVLNNVAHGNKFIKNRCIDCRYCGYDENGKRYCKKLLHCIPENMTAADISNLYPIVQTSKLTGRLVSSYTPFAISDCEFHVSRR